LRKKIDSGSFRLFGREIDYRYSRPDDILTLKVSDEPVARTEETEHGLIDYDANGNIVEIEVFAASRVSAHVDRIEPDRPSLDVDLSNAISQYVHEAREHVKIGS
jgi:uncharacterized protein YuzE